MKLSKQLKTDLAKAFQCAMEVCILDMKAPLRYINQYIAEDVSGFGTAADEKVQSRADFKKMILDARRQAKGMPFKARITTPCRPKFIDETTAQFRDEMVVDIGDKKNKHSIQLWFSTLFKYRHNKWQMVMFHGSMPDLGSSSADTFHVAEAEKKLKELEQVVAERTADLQKKSRELEIEAALERVRTVAMSMMKEDDLLNITKAQYKELKKLGFTELRNSLIGVFHDDKNYLRDYDYSDFSGGGITNIPYHQNAVVDRSLKQMKKASDAFTEFIVEGKELKEWKAFRKRNGEYEDKRLKDVKALYYYFYSIEQGSVGISSFKKISTEQLDILKRFRNVFELAYKRYVDIATAAAQAREAEIEASLERVRSAAMTMKKSDDLVSICKAMYKELLSLGFDNIRNAQIGIKNDDKQAYLFYVYSDFETIVGGEVAYDNSPIMLRVHKELGGAGDGLFEKEYSPAEMKEWRRFREGLSPFKDEREKTTKSLCWYLYAIGKGNIGISTFNIITKDQIEIVKRFKNVFELSYQRFHDLQKAEAQARESKIEAALEKVRSRSLSMHKSNELNEVVTVLFEKLKELQIPVTAVGIHIFTKGSKDVNVYVCGDIGNGLAINNYILPYFNHPIADDLNDAHEKRLDYFVGSYSKKEKNSFYKYVFEHSALRDLPGEIKNMILQSQSYSIAMAPVKNAVITVNDFEGKPLSDGNADVVKRFAKVFEQAYIRFLDLQKAEAQAREAEIELGLERVRAAAMAMRAPSEIGTLIYHLYGELNKLDALFERCFIMIVNPENQGITWWMAGMEGLLNENGFFVPYNQHKTHLLYLQNWKKSTKKWQYLFEGKEKNDWDRFGFGKTELSKLPEPVKKDMAGVKKIYLSGSSDKFGCLVTGSVAPLSEENQNIISRFATVFNQTYTRFLDLQKAVAQAREAQIEAGLERVRANAMAMQSSEELKTLIGTVFTELTKLDLALTRCIIWVFEPTTNATRWWMANSEEPSNPMSFFIKYHKHPAYLKFVKEWKNQNVKFVYDLRGTDKRKWDDILFNETELKNLPTVVIDGMKQPERVLLSASFNNFGGINVASLETLSDEHFDILLRFAKVFDLTYTRFLDLQKAEAQARESQIQLALERVRARTMAMQKSEELGEAASLLFQQVRSLGIESYSSGFTVWENNDGEMVSWMCNADGSINPPFRMPAKEIDWHRQQYDSWKKKEVYIIHDFTGKEMKDYYKYLRSFPLLDEAFKKSETAGVITPARQVHNAFNFSNGNLLFITLHPVSGSYDIFKRFAKTFEQTYTRFLDLQKAEAQAREAQIETALERVRSRTMGMQKSDELKEVIRLVFEQFIHLNINVGHAGFYIDYKAHDDMHIWLADPNIDPFYAIIPYFDTPTWNSFRDAKARGKNFFTNLLDFRTKNKFYKSLFKLFKIPEEAKTFYLQCKGLAVSTVLLDNVGLYIENFDGTPYSEEENNLLMRFGKVFQQTYTRFLDLEKAEAQAKEAKIEAALERVRSQAMGMIESSDLLDIVVTMRNEFTALGYEAGYFWHMMWLPDKYEKAMTSGDGTKIGMVMELPRHIHGNIPLLSKWEKSKKPTVVFAMDVETAVDYVHKMITLGNFQQVDPQAPTLDDIRHIGGLTFIMARTTHGEIGYSLTDVVSDPPKENLEVLTRFAGAFDIAHRRFLDLKKTEAQTREVQIELALERVRSRTMAMQKSEELAEISTELFKQVQSLGVPCWFCAFNINDDNPDSSLEWGSNGELAFPKYRTPRVNIFLRYYEAGKRGETLFINEIGKDECPAHYEYLCTLPGVGEQLLKMKSDGIPFPSSQIDHVAFFKYGYILFITYDPAPEAYDIFKRFANVFEQTYTRFLDLQKAEAQAKEAQIEAALERTRTQSMLMQNSNELNNAVSVFHAQLQLLGMDSEFSYLWLPDEKKSNHLFWATWDEMENEETVYKNKSVVYPLDKSEPSIAACYEAWASRNPIHINPVPPADVENYFATWSELLQDIEKFKPEHFSDGLYYVDAYMMYGCFGIVIRRTLTEYEKEVLNRFAKVFEQTYTRFLDLQKAEAQAREAQIEAALERVRSRTMAMQNSNELQETAAVLFEEFKKLGTEEIYQVTIGIYNEEELLIDFRVTDWTGSGQLEQRTFQLDMNEPSLLQPANAAWKEGKKSAVFDLTGKKLKAWLNYRNKISGITMNSRDTQGRRVISVAYFSKGHLSLSSPLPLLEETIKTLERFASVFDGTYTRFLDLEKAEAQAREAKIEAALEKVRSRTLAMQKSDELAETAAEVFHQLIGLGIDPNRLYIGIVNGDTKDMEMWATDEDGTGIGKKFNFNAFDNDSVKKLYDGWTAKLKSISVDMQGKELEAYFHYLQSLQIPINHGIKQKRRVQSVAYFDKGFIGMASPDDQSVQNIQLLERFAAVFNLTFTRFSDLKIAEAQAREAQIEASLERMRSAAMSIRKSEELIWVAESLYKELKGLGISNIRNAQIVIKLDDQENYLVCIFSDIISEVFNESRYETSPITQQMYDELESSNEALYQRVLTGNEFELWMDWRKNAGAKIEPRLLEARTVSFCLYSIGEGHLGISAYNNISDEQLSVLKRFRNVFELSYRRFMDVAKSEEQALKLQLEKERLENTISELQATQKQLIQSEKMASLGELTAGIAHEIQNPLNFVNNFSDVSKELLDEMKEAMEKGDSEEAKEIMQDVIANLEKINHHDK